MNHDKLFTLRVNVGRGPMVVITAFDANHTDPQTGHMRIDVEVKQGGRVVFKRGETYCAVNRWTAIDGIEAKELVMSLVAMKPGDTDADYFAGYTADQLAWACEYGEEISMIREMRYCDENGSVRSKLR